MNFGALGSGALSGTTLSFQAQFVLTTSAPGTSFDANLIVGDPPAATSRFAQAMASLADGGSGSTGAGVSTAEAGRLLLAAPMERRFA